MDGQYWKGDRTMSTNEWLLTSDFWQFLEPWHGRWYEYEIFIASCTDNIYDLENERSLLGDMIDHVGIYGSKVAEGLSAFNAGLVIFSWKFQVEFRDIVIFHLLWLILFYPIFSLDMLDKVDPPGIPDGYGLSLAFLCLLDVVRCVQSLIDVDLEKQGAQKEEEEEKPNSGKQDLWGVHLLAYACITRVNN